MRSYSDGLLIDGDHHGAGAGRLDAVQHFAIVVQFQLGIKLKPERAFGRRGDLFERKAGDVAHDVWSIGCGYGALIRGHFAIRVKHGVAGGRRNQDGVIHRGAEELGGRVDGAGVENPIGKQLDPIERLAVAAEGEFAIRPVGGVVVVVPGDLGVCHGFEVECREEFIQARERGCDRGTDPVGNGATESRQGSLPWPGRRSSDSGRRPRFDRHAARSLQRGFRLKRISPNPRIGGAGSRILAPGPLGTGRRCSKQLMNQGRECLGLKRFLDKLHGVCAKPVQFDGIPGVPTAHRMRRGKNDGQAWNFRAKKECHTQPRTCRQSHVGKQ